MLASKNGEILELQQDINTIKDTLVALSDNVGKIAAPLEHVSNALTVVSQRLDYLCNTLTQMISLWEKSIPIRLAILLVLLVALAFGGNRILELFSKVPL